MFSHHSSSTPTPDVVAHGMADEAQGTSSEEWCPIRVDFLPDRPRIIAHLGRGWLERQLSLEDLAGTYCGRLDGNKGLDLTTNTNLNQKAVDVGRILVDQYDRESLLPSKIAKILGLNLTAVMGTVEVGNVTAGHEHINGVLHMAGLGGCKLWLVRCTIEGASHQPQTVVQRDGDMLWLPPGWSHEVRTMNGHMCNGRELCMHWVSWCMPFARLERAILAYACGVIGEGQNKNGRTLKRLGLLHALVLESKAARRDKKRPFDGRIEVGERFQAHIPDYRGEIPDTPRQSAPKAGRQRT